LPNNIFTLVLERWSDGNEPRGSNMLQQFEYAFEDRANWEKRHCKNKCSRHCREFILALAVYLSKYSW